MDQAMGKEAKMDNSSFGFAKDFLSKHQEVIVLTSQDSGGQILISPTFQGRVMTSTVSGLEGRSIGWINFSLIESGKQQKGINPFGGEDRLWIGPEGGQYSFFFKKGEPFNISHWQTPAPVDIDPFKLVSASKDSATFLSEFSLTNYSNNTFDIKINRTINVLSREDVNSQLGIQLPENIQYVAYQSSNELVNNGKNEWSKNTGLPSLWILGMYNPSDFLTVVIPYNKSVEAVKAVNDAYFGKPGSERLKIKDGLVFFKGDANFRSKIGLSYKAAKPVLGSYDPVNNLLTIVQYNLPKQKKDYVNSLWKIQEDSYEGDVVNSYNDGPVADGAASIGGFYELETSSPAAALAPGQNITHIHRTYHFKGRENTVNQIAEKVLGTNLQSIKNALL